jgi:hypothetical protein
MDRSAHRARGGRYYFERLQRQPMNYSGPRLHESPPIDRREDHSCHDPSLEIVVQVFFDHEGVTRPGERGEVCRW